MLFDTQSPGRRRFVQITFAFLAILMGGGLVLFGIGGAGNGGGIVDALGNKTTNIDDTAKKDAVAAQKVLDVNPKDEAAAAKLAKANLLIATSAAFDPTTGEVAQDGAGLITAADNSWTSYLALGPAKPSSSVAIQYSSFYALPGVAKYDKAARAIETVLVTRKPSTGLYSQLAIYALASGDNDKYKTARAQALKLAPTAERRTAVAKELDTIEKNIKDQQDAAAKQADAQTGATGTTGSTPPLKTLPSLGG